MKTQSQLFPVTRELVPENQRLAITEKLFGIHFPLKLEPVIYGITERMAEDYTGGYWEFYTLSNGGFYMAPSGDDVPFVGLGRPPACRLKPAPLPSVPAN